MRLNHSQIVEGFKEHLAVQFAGQERETVSLTTGKHHSYLATHLEEVPRLAAEIISRVRYSCPELLTGMDPLHVELIARGHDLLEDGFGNGCPKGCQKKPTCPEHYVRLAEDTRQKLMELGLPSYDAEYCVNQIRALSKDYSLPKKGRNQELYRRLRRHPFEVKLVKMADNWHNMQTLHGRGLEKALKNYVRVRGSWPTIFSLDELIALSGLDVNMIEDPETMARRTHLFKHLYEALREGQDLPDDAVPFSSEPIPENPFGDFAFELENPTYLYKREIRTLKEEGFHFNFHEGALQKIKNLCTPSVTLPYGPEVPVAAEGQILLADMMDKERLSTLYIYSERGLGQFHNVLARLMLDDSEVCAGKTGCSPWSVVGGERERMLGFVGAVGMSGEELLKIRDEGEFKMIVEQAILRERKKGN